jgi:phage shock protein A
MGKSDLIRRYCEKNAIDFVEHLHNTEKQTPYNNVDLLRKQFAEIEERFQSVVKASAQVIAEQHRCIKELEKAIHSLKYGVYP